MVKRGIKEKNHDPKHTNTVKLHPRRQILRQLHLHSPLPPLPPIPNLLHQPVQLLLHRPYHPHTPTLNHLRASGYLSTHPLVPLVHHFAVLLPRLD